jgi:hypothetical protein
VWKLKKMKTALFNGSPTANVYEEHWAKRLSKSPGIGQFSLALYSGWGRDGRQTRMRHSEVKLCLFCQNWLEEAFWAKTPYNVILHTVVQNVCADVKRTVCYSPVRLALGITCSICPKCCLKILLNGKELFCTKTVQNEAMWCPESDGWSLCSGDCMAVSRDSRKSHKFRIMQNSFAQVSPICPKCLLILISVMPFLALRFKLNHSF